MTRLLIWLLARRAGGQLAPQLEKILADRVCATCGTWRCPECHYLILCWWDHAPLCRIGDRQKASES